MLKDNTYIYDDCQIAAGLASYYSNLCSDVLGGRVGAVDVGVQANFLYSQEKEYNKHFTMHELRQALDYSKTSAPVPDFIQAEFVKQMTIGQLEKILIFYNCVWNHGVPVPWKECITIPLLKYGRFQTCIESYRSISLRNNICKIRERMVTKITKLLEGINSIKSLPEGIS